MFMAQKCCEKYIFKNNFEKSMIFVYQKNVSKKIIFFSLFKNCFNYILRFFNRDTGGAKKTGFPPENAVFVDNSLKNDFCDF